MTQAAPTAEIKAIREVRAAAHKLDVACLAIVGETKMALGRAGIEALAEPVPEDMLELATKLQHKLDGLN